MKLHALAFVLLAACGGGSSSYPPVIASPPPPPMPDEPLRPLPQPRASTPAAPALHGIYIGDIDKAADPCTDFFQYANGAWRAANPIPASQPKWSRRWEAGEVAKDNLKQLLEAVAAKKNATPGSPDQIVGDFYGACMDEAKAEQVGIAPIAGLVDEIDRISTRADVGKELIALHAIGVNVGFGFGSQQDPHQPQRVLADVGSGGLGLPDRDYYVKTEPRFVDARKQYKAHMAKLFAIAGRKETAAQLDAVFALETAFARVTLDNVAQRDPKAHDHPTTFKKLLKLAPHVDWTAYLDAAKVPHDDLNVDEPKFLAAYDQALATTPVATWKTYFTWNVLRGAAPFLNKAMVDEAFAFDEAYLSGAKEIKPRWKRCAEAADHLFGEALGQQYVAKYFPPAAKARVSKMVENILAAAGDSIRDASWMSDKTKQRALAKLATFNPKIGYPDTWKDYAGVVVARDTLWADLVAGSRYAVSDDRAQIGKPVDRKRFGMTPPTSDAYYNPQLNEIVFPAGILQPPMFDMTATDAVNYGSIGIVIGHEISHGFDDQGAQYDAQGALSNWWTPEDLKQFQTRGKCVSDQFEGYFIEPKIHHQGKLVLGEALGDLGGVMFAFRGFQKSLGGATAPTIDGITPEQQFFIAFGQWRGDETRPEAMRKMVQGDPHPVAKFRVIGSVVNAPQFAKAFSCKAGAAMVRPDNARCTIW